MLGVLRAYKGLPDAVTAVLGVDGARLLVAGDPREPIDARASRLGARGEWRLGWFTDHELGAALAETTVALFPYRPELDQSGALLQALGHGVPAIVYDVGGLGEVVRAYGAGRVVPAGDVAAMTAALDELLGTTGALAAAQAGAERARDELTWDASARAHLELYEELMNSGGTASTARLAAARLFASDEQELLREADEADEAWTRAGRDETEELYGDYQLVVDAIADRLLDIRETYARTLDEQAATSTARASQRLPESGFGGTRGCWRISTPI